MQREWLDLEGAGEERERRMSVQFEWQCGNDDGDWEVLAKTEKRRRFGWVRRVPWWGWAILGAVLVMVVAGGYLLVRQRYQEAVRQVAFQIQGVIDIEARAYARQDEDLFLAQQDEASPEWYAEQERRLRSDCFWLSQPAGRLYDPCAPVLPAKVENVELRGDMAWVEVIEDGSSARKVRFYRQTEQGWQQTAPRVEFWQAAIELQYGGLVFRYHRRDEPYVDPLVQRSYEATRDICAVLPCSASDILEVNFAADVPLSQLPRVDENALVLASPWLTGIPSDGAWDELYLQRVTYTVAREVALRALRSATGHELNPLQTALLDEYAAWYTFHDTAQAPILGRVVERHGEGVLPEVLRSLSTTRSLSMFIDRWLSLTPADQEVAYFETLLNIEREAAGAGRKDTFFLLQEGSDRWLRQQELFFQQAQMRYLALSAVEVLDVDVNSAQARVMIKGPALRISGQGTTSLRAFVFFRLHDGDWKHTNLIAF
jgi:hypothetical protein